MAIWNGFKSARIATKSDTVNETTPFDALFVAVTGNAVIVPADGDATVTMTGLPVGTFIPIKTKRVNSTGTTATLVGLWGA